MLIPAFTDWFIKCKCLHIQFISWGGMNQVKTTLEGECVSLGMVKSSPQFQWCEAGTFLLTVLELQWAVFDIRTVLNTGRIDARKLKKCIACHLTDKMILGLNSLHREIVFSLPFDFIKMQWPNTLQKMKGKETLSGCKMRHYRYDYINIRYMDTYIHMHLHMQRERQKNKLIILTNPWILCS